MQQSRGPPSIGADEIKEERLQQEDPRAGYNVREKKSAGRNPGKMSTLVLQIDHQPDAEAVKAFHI